MRGVGAPPRAGIRRLAGESLLAGADRERFTRAGKRDSSAGFGAYQALEKEIEGRRDDVPRTEMLDLVVVNGRARGIVVRDMERRDRNAFGRRGDLGTAATAMSSSSTNAKGRTRPRSGARTSGAPRSRIHASRRFTDVHPGER